MYRQEASPSFPTMDFATGQRVPDVDAIRTYEGMSWFAIAKAICVDPWIAPDPTLPALDTIYPLLISECGDPTALCSVCAILRCDAPARADCETCARGAA